MHILSRQCVTNVLNEYILLTSIYEMFYNEKRSEVRMRIRLTGGVVDQSKHSRFIHTERILFPKVHTSKRFLFLPKLSRNL